MVWSFLFKLKVDLPRDLAMALLAIHPGERNINVHTIIVHECFPCDKQTLKAPQIFFKGKWLQTVLRPSHVILPSNREEGTLSTPDSSNGPVGCCA